MFKFFLLAALNAFAAADGDDVHADTTLQRSDVRKDGFDTIVETNHIHQAASGNEHINIHGNFSRVDPKSVKVDSDDCQAETVIWKADFSHNGFNVEFEISNYIRMSASGDDHGNIHGDFSWVDPNGVKVETKFVADEHGYYPEGELLHIPHPIPENIIKIFECIKANASKKEPSH